MTPCDTTKKVRLCVCVIYAKCWRGRWEDGRKQKKNQSEGMKRIGKKSALYIHAFPATLGMLAGFSPAVMWIPLYSSPWFVVLCAGMSRTKSLFILFFYLCVCFFSLPSISEVKGLKGSVWKLEVMPPNPPRAEKYSEDSLETHMPANMSKHTTRSGCKN